jgi:hypothetical protein
MLKIDQNGRLKTDGWFRVGGDLVKLPINTSANVYYAVWDENCTVYIVK